MKRPINRGVTPIGGMCRYVDPDAGFVVSHPYWYWCQTWAKAERIKRGLPIPYDWDRLFEQGFCAGTAQGCFEVPDAPVEKGPSWTKMAVQFGASMARWVKAGMPITTWEEFKVRYAKCTGDENNPRCTHFTQFSGTGVARCGKCGCTSVKLFLKTERCPIGKW